MHWHVEPSHGLSRSISVAVMSCVVTLVFTRWYSGLPVLMLLRMLADGVCAHLPGHMLAPGGVPLPLCARTTGLYTGLLLGTVHLASSGKLQCGHLPSRRAIAIFLLVIVVMVVDGLNSCFVDVGLPHLYAPSNSLRLLTGMGAGLSLPPLVMPVFMGALLVEPDRQGTFSHVGDVVRYLLCGVVVSLVILTAWPPLLYPVAVASMAGLLVLLGLFDLAVLAPLLGFRRALTGLGDLGFWTGPLALLCLAQLAGLHWVRTMLVGM